MATEKELFAKYGIELERLRGNLVNNISNKGVNVSSTATLQELVPLVNDINGVKPYILTSDKILENTGTSCLSDVKEYIDENAVIVEKSAFNYALCSFIDLPNVLELNDEAFAFWNYSNSDVNFNIPNVEILGNGVFSSAFAIHNYFKNNSGMVFSNVTTMRSGAFMGLMSYYTTFCTFSFPKMKILSNNAFESCNDLGSNVTLDFPEVTIIQKNAFNSFNHFSPYLSINLPKVTTIESNAFTYISASNCVLYFSLNTIKTLGSCAFMYNQLGFGTIGESIGNISGHKVSVFNNVTTIPSSCFYGYSDIFNQSIEFMSVNTIQSNAFCNAFFNKIKFNYNKPIGIYSNAFKYASITNISGLTMRIVYSDAFYSTSALTSASIYSTSTISGILYSYAFREAKNLSIVSGYIKSIPSGVFVGCSNLYALYLLNVNSSITPLNVSAYAAFSGTPIYNGLGSIYVPSSLYSTYISATNWVALSSAFVSM